MSNFKKNVLAVALVAGLGLAGTAIAYDLTTGGDTDPVMVATADVVDATTPIGVNEDTTISLEGSDFILGRTTGFTIRITLNNGATFDASLTTADLTIGAPNSSWTPSIVAGGGDGDNFVVINMDPTATPVALTTGDLLTINGADLVANPTLDAGLVLDSLTALQTEGASVTATVQFVDPVTAAAIMPQGTITLLESGDPVEFACDANDGDVSKRIDVGVTSQAAKTYFSSSGVIGGANQGYINLGSIGASVAAGFSFSYLAADEFQTVATGDFSAFTASPAEAGRSVFLSTSNTCSSQDVVGVVNNATGTVTFDYTGADVGMIDGSTTFTAYLCASVPSGNETIIDASSVSATTTFTRGDVSSTSSSCSLLPLRYNGSVVQVYHINPAGNTTAQSFVRVINPSDVSGTVTLTGIDDSGNAAAAPITFVLGAGRSMQINSEDLENGNAAKGLTGAWGDGAGKWRATVTGEFAGMRVQGLNRNANDGTVTNLTDADGQGEQFLDGYYDQGGFF